MKYAYRQRPAPGAQPGQRCHPVADVSPPAIRRAYLLRFKGIMLAALRTESPGDMFLEGIPFPFPGMVFMLPKGLIRHPEEGDCPYIAFSKHTKGERYDLPVAELSCPAIAPKDTVIASTYMPQAAANVNYFKSVPILAGKSIAECFAEANKTEDPPIRVRVNQSTFKLGSHGQRFGVTGSRKLSEFIFT
jgi:hypothetical protein